jgi:hypothetical protein
MEVDNARVIIFGPKGNVTGESRYLTIGEAEYDLAWVIARVGKGKDYKSTNNKMTIEVNRSSSNISYYSPDE